MTNQITIEPKYMELREVRKEYFNPGDKYLLVVVEIEPTTMLDSFSGEYFEATESWTCIHYNADDSINSVHHESDAADVFGYINCITECLWAVGTTGEEL